MNIERQFLTNARMAPKFPGTGTSIRRRIGDLGDMDDIAVELQQEAEDNELLTQKCTKCKEHKVLTQFYRNKSKLLGRCTECIECYRKREKTTYDENSKKFISRVRQWQNDNYEKHMASQKK